MARLNESDLHPLFFMRQPSLHSLSKLALSFGLLAVLGLGCGNSGIQVRDEGKTFDLQGSGNEGIRAGENITIPATFPADFPRYPGAVNKFALKDGESYTVNQETADDIDTVVRHFDQQLTQVGYNMTVRLGNVGEPVQILDYGHAEKQLSVRIQISRDPEKQKTFILIARVPKPQ